MGETRPLGHWPACPTGSRRYGSQPAILHVDTAETGSIPWSLFQYLVHVMRDLSMDFRSWAKWGSYSSFGVWHKTSYMEHSNGGLLWIASESIREANRSNPLLMDLESAYPEPQDVRPRLPVPARGRTAQASTSGIFFNDLVSENISVPVKDLLVLAEAHSLASTTSQRMRCHWRPRLGRRIMPRTVWVCGLGGFWARRTQFLLQKAPRPKLLRGTTTSTSCSRTHGSSSRTGS